LKVASVKKGKPIEHAGSRRVLDMPVREQMACASRNVVEPFFCEDCGDENAATPYRRSHAIPERRGGLFGDINAIFAWYGASNIIEDA
jgi:hypothetical protein